MTKKHFITIAAIFKAALDRPTTQREREMLEHIAGRIAYVCREDNPSFDREKFLEACGLQ